MKPRTYRLIIALFAIGIFCYESYAQQIQRAPFDVTNYKMDVTLNPDENRIQSVVDVTFIPLQETRTVAFELNGSLRVESITRERETIVSTPKKPRGATVNTTQITFVQDQVGVSDIGPNVKVDLGENVAAQIPVTLRFKYSGNLVSAEGGPLLVKRLAFIGDNYGYLMYAARWFPFHDYAADRATSEINISIPGGYTVAGYSDSPASQTGGKFRFVTSKQTLLGNFVFGKNSAKILRFSDYELQFFVRPGADAFVALYGEIIGRALEAYTRKYGETDFGKRLVVAQTDDDTIDFYSAPGMIFIANKFFETERPGVSERLQREVAFQWWGQTVGLKSFDDALISQGLAEYSAFELREANLNGAALESLRREMLEKSLTFEQSASLIRAPSTLDDQSTAYQYIMYAKGAMVFKLLRDTLGEAKFQQLLRTFLQQYRGKNASIEDFEKLTSQIAGTNMRYFFARWVESTGVPEFSVDYQIIRTRGGKFRTRGTVKQNYDNLRLTVELKLRAEGEGEIKTVPVRIDESSEDFNIESNGKPIEVIVDPNFKLLRISDELRISAIARRGIEQFKDGNFAESQQQFEAALKLDRNNSWVYYNLGVLFLEQKNYDLAIDNFKAALNGDLRPAWLAVWSNVKMGNAYDAKGDRARAVAAYKRAEALGDDYDDAQDAVKKYLANPFDYRQKQLTEKS